MPPPGRSADRRSDDGGGTDTRVLADGAIRLGPPGFEVAIAVSYPED